MTQQRPSVLCVGPHDEGEEQEPAPGSLCCRWCRKRAERALRDLPTWWADLGDPRRGQRPRSGGKSAEAPEPLGDDARRLRDAVKNLLVSWCLVLRDDRDVGLPDEQRIVTGSGRLIRDLQEAELGEWQAAHNDRCEAQKAGRDDDTAKSAKLQGSSRRHRKRAGDLHRQVEEIRETRAAGADVIAALCEHIGRHLDWLLASVEHSDLFLAQVIGQAGQARRAAHPSRPDAVVTCTCGSKVALDADRSQITCPGCGEWGDVGWWWDRVGEHSPRPLKITELSVWLQVHHKLDVTTKQLRNWRDRGLLVALPVEGSGAGAAQRFDPTAVAAVVLARLGHDASSRLSA